MAGPGPCPSPPDASAAGLRPAARRASSSPASFSHGLASRAAAAAAGLALALALACAPAVAADGSSDREIAWPEGSVARVLTLPAHPASEGWRLSGPDASRFRIAAGALRFAARPDFERPGDADGDNRYEVTLEPGAGADAVSVTVRVEDRDEPGRAVAEPRRPVVGEPVRVRLSDPDLGPDPGNAADPAVRWERWRSPGTWQAIPEASGSIYTPTPADASRHLRAVVTYADRHGPGRRAVAALAHAVLGPMLTALDARADSGRTQGAGLRPAFDPRIRHYGLACAERDVMTVSFAAPPGVRVSVNDIQPRTDMTPSGPRGAAAAAVTPDGDVAVTVAAPDGAYTTYTVHCMPPELWAVRTEPDPARPLDVLLAVTAGPWAAVLDEHGVSRAHVRAERGTAGFFLRPFGSGPDRRWAHVEKLPEDKQAPTGQRQHWRVLGRNLEPLRTVATAAPLTTTGRHDFRLLADGSALLMTYEPAVRDLRGLSFPDREGKPFGPEVQMEDSAIQLRGPDGAVRWTWSSWGRLPLEDCAQHRFPEDWAHVNSLQWTEQGVLASFRGCSAIVMIDPKAPPGEEIVWRIGASNLATEDWQRRGLGPPPLRIVGDVEGAFCGQHAAQLLPPPPGLALPRLLLFDNGVACVTDPHTGKPLGRQSEVYSRAVEYALDLEHGEAVFVRDHALGNARNSLGFARGHVVPLPDGDWLVSWGFGGQTARQPAEHAGKPPADVVTRVNPETGAESFRIPAEGGKPLRALPVSPLALLRPPVPLNAVLPDLPPAGHAGDEDRVAIAVAFSRPVVAFGPETGSVAVEGGELVAAAPLAGFGRPAHAWTLVLAPAGDGPLTLRFRAGVACAGKVTGTDAAGPAPGICTADGARLRGAPRALTIPRTRSENLPRTRSGTLPRLAGGTAAPDRAAGAGETE